MLALTGSPMRLCEGITRREWLRVGALALAGLTLPQLLGARAAAPSHNGGRAKACIVVFLFGAPAHQDIWDLKPEARSEYRGEFRPIATNVPGIRVGEYIPLTAQQAQRLAL